MQDVFIVYTKYFCQFLAERGSLYKIYTDKKIYIAYHNTTIHNLISLQPIFPKKLKIYGKRAQIIKKMPYKYKLTKKRENLQKNKIATT
jgi:hypothetical protein